MVQRANFPLILVGNEDHSPRETALLTQLFDFSVYFHTLSWPFAVNHESCNSPVEDGDAPGGYRPSQDFSSGVALAGGGKGQSTLANCPMQG